MVASLEFGDQIVSNRNDRNGFLLNRAIGWLVVQAIVFAALTSAIWAQEGTHKLPSKVRNRLELKTPVEDKLLHGLERDFVKLLKKSRNADALIEAEELLEATNDNTHWTNYSRASKILRRTRDKAAIPLLLRYIVEHSQRSACHVMIPEYARTITLISGHQLENPYEAGPGLEQRMRSKVDKIVKEWWSKEVDKLATEPDKLSDAQLRVIVTNLLHEIRRSGNYSGAGGKYDSAYGAYHNVYYRVVNNSSSNRYEIPELHPAMITLVLEPSGYRSTDRPKIQPVRRFPYETIPILGELAKNGHRKKIEEIANDRKQNSSVRLACILSLYRAGEVLRVPQLLEMLENETILENRLITLLALRWGGEKAVAVLLKHMDDPNIEIATAAACALTDAQPNEALPKFRELLSRDHLHAPILLLSALATYENRTSRTILAEMLKKSVEGGSNKQHLGRILSAFTDACDLPRPSDPRGEDKSREQARLALARYHAKAKEQEILLSNLTALVASLRIQLKVAQGIETQRRNEYKRLLALQGDNIVTAERSQKASGRLEAVAAEVKVLRSQLDEAEAQLDTLRTMAK